MISMASIQIIPPSLKSLLEMVKERCFSNSPPGRNRSDHPETGQRDDYPSNGQTELQRDNCQ
jgi:hypothetical protein